MPSALRGIGSATYLRQHRRKAYRPRWSYAVIGAVWGLLASFSFAVSDEKAPLYQALGLSSAVAATLLEQRAMAAITSWTSSAVGLLVALHAILALLSGALAGSSVAAVARYLLLLPTVSLLISVVRRGPPALEGLRLGLTLSGLVFVLFHAIDLGPGSLLDPDVRLSTFLNPNGVGFIAAMTAVSVITFRRPSLLHRALMYGCFAASSVVCLATKSRTALLTLLAGLVTYVYLRAKNSPRLRVGLMLAIVAALIVATQTSVVADINARLTSVYMLDDKYRSIQTGTFRYKAWWFVLRELWPQNPLLGVGPGRHSQFVEAAVDVSGAHNGLLTNLAEVGALGTLPLLVALGISLTRARRHAASQTMAPLLVAGIVESFAETMFFSMGSTGSLLFMAALVCLGTRPATPLPHVNG